MLDLCFRVDEPIEHEIGQQAEHPVVKDVATAVRGAVCIISRVVRLKVDLDN